MPNDELFVKVLAQIEREPHRWDQGSWAKEYDHDGNACGTSYCFAGHAVVLSGQAAQIEWKPKLYGRVAAQLTDGTEIGQAAADLLGIELDVTYPEDFRLFRPLNTLDDLYGISADLLGINEQVLRDKVAAEVAA